MGPGKAARIAARRHTRPLQGIQTRLFLAADGIGKGQLAHRALDHAPDAGA